MSGKVVGWAFDEGEDRRLELSRRFVLVAYADNADRYGKCFPSMKEIIGKTGTSRATWYRAKDELIEAGLMAFAHDEKGREYVQLAVPWASHHETDSSHGETKPPEASSQPETPKSQGEIGSSHGETGSNKGTVKNRQEPSSESADADDHTADFSILPSVIAAPLRQVAEAKDGTFDPHSVKRACDAHPDRDHVAEAEAFAAWHLSGNGKNAPMRVAGVAFKKWLAKGTPVQPGKVTKLQAVPALDREKIAEGLPALAEKWPAIVERLRTSVPDSTFRLWVEPLVPVGMTGGKVYLTGPEGIRAWAERRYSSLLAAAAEDALGEKVSVLFLPAETESAA